MLQLDKKNGSSVFFCPIPEPSILNEDREIGKHTRRAEHTMGGPEDKNAGGKIQGFGGRRLVRMKHPFRNIRGRGLASVSS